MEPLLISTQMTGATRGETLFITSLHPGGDSGKPRMRPSECIMKVRISRFSFSLSHGEIMVVNPKIEAALIKESEERGDTLATVDRLLNCKKDTEQRLVELRKLQILEEMSHLKDRPTIGKYKISSPRTPIHLRDNKGKNFDEQLTDIRNADPNRYKDLMKECTFSPRINRSRSGRRSFNDLLEWGQEKRFKQTHVRLNAMMDKQHSYSPKINPRSRKLAGNRRGPIHRRLMQAGTNRDEKINILRKSENDLMFRPAIGDRSRKLAKKAKEIRLVKFGNGKTQNLDFYYAVPENSSKGTLIKRAPGGEDLIDIRNLNRHIERCETYQKPQSTLPGKKSNPYPGYVSPYSKEIMTSDIPLKTILNKAAKLRESPRKKRKQQRISRARSRSRSRSTNRRSRSARRSKSRQSLRTIQLIDASLKEYELAESNELTPRKNNKQNKSLNTTAASMVLPIKNGNSNKARRSQLDSTRLAQDEARKSRSRSKKMVNNMIYSHRLSPSRNDKFKNDIGISTSKQIALDSQKTYQNSPEWEGQYFDKAYFNRTLVVTRDLKDWKEEY